MEGWFRFSSSSSCSESSAPASASSSRTSYRPPPVGSPISTATCRAESESPNAFPNSGDPRQNRRLAKNQGSRHARAVSAYHVAAAYNAASKTIIPNAPAAVIGCVPPTPPEATSRPTREEAKFASVSGSRPASAWTATSMDAANATGESRDAAANASPDAPKYVSGTKSAGARTWSAPTATRTSRADRAAAATRNPSETKDVENAIARSVKAAKDSVPNRPKKTATVTRHVAPNANDAVRSAAVPAQYAEGSSPADSSTARRRVRRSSEV